MVEASLDSQFDNLFRGRRNACGSYDISAPKTDADGKVTGKAVTRKDLDPSFWLPAWERHLQGTSPFLGIHTIDESGNCYWGCLDGDSKLGIPAEDIAVRLAKKKRVPMIVCRSKSENAWHAYLFTETPVPAAKMREALETYRDELGLPESVEIYPNADASTATYPGGWVNAPFFGESCKAVVADTNSTPPRCRELSREEFLVRAQTQASLIDWSEEEDPRPAKMEASSPGKAQQRKRKDYENGPEEGGRWKFFKSELGRFLESVPIVSEEIAQSYANLMRDTMLTPRPTEKEWFEEYRPTKICRIVVAKELKRREDGKGPKVKKKSREEAIIEAKAEIQENFTLARDAIDRVYYYNAELGRYEFDDHLQFSIILDRILTANDYAIGKYDKDKMLLGLAQRARPFLTEPPLDRINLKNGILRLADETLEPHSPDFLHPNQFDVAWDPTATCPETDAFLNDIVYDDEVVVFYEWMGYLLLPDKSMQKALLCHGAGANGKSQMLKLMTGILGRRNYSAIPLHKLEANTFAASGLVGKLANFEFDASDVKMPGSAFFKSLVGDDDAMNIEKKHQDAKDIELYTRLIMSCNRFPRSADNTIGYWRKWMSLSFTKRDFANNAEDVKRRRDSDDLVGSMLKEASGILVKSIRAYKEMKVHKKFTESERMRETMRQFKELTDSVAVWLADNTILGEKLFVQQKQLHAAYNEHCSDKGFSHIDAAEFSQKVIEFSKSSVKTEARHGSRCFVGIGMRSEHTDSDHTHF